MSGKSVPLWSALIYGCVVGAAYLSDLVLWLWPVPFVLGIQDLLPSQGLGYYRLVLWIGFAPILLTAWLYQRKLERLDREVLDYVFAALLTTFLTLVSLTIASQVVARLLGWDYGV